MAHLHLNKIQLTQLPTTVIHSHVDWVLEQPVGDANFFEHIFSATRYISHLEAVNKQNCRIWDSASLQTIEKRKTRQLFGPEVWLDLTSLKTTTTGLLLLGVGSHSKMWFQQDGATCHSIRANMALLREKFPGHGISRLGDCNCPPRPCNLRLLDFLVDKAFTLEQTNRSLETLAGVHLNDNFSRQNFHIFPFSLHPNVHLLMWLLPASAQLRAKLNHCMYNAQCWQQKKYTDAKYTHAQIYTYIHVCIYIRTFTYKYWYALNNTGQSYNHCQIHMQQHVVTLANVVALTHTHAYIFISACGKQVKIHSLLACEYVCKCVANASVVHSWLLAAVGWQCVDFISYCWQACRLVRTSWATRAATALIKSHANKQTNNHWWCVPMSEWAEEKILKNL